MYLGRIGEAGAGRLVYDAPRHPYTVALLSAAPGRRPGRGRRPAADHPHRRRAVADRPARGLPLPPALPEGAGVCGVEPPLQQPSHGPQWTVVRRPGKDCPASRRRTHVTACHFPVEPGETLAARRHGRSPLKSHEHHHRARVPGPRRRAEQRAEARFEGRSQWQLTWRRLRSDKVAMIALAIIVIMVLLAIVAPLIAALTAHGSNTAFPDHRARTADGNPVGRRAPTASGSAPTPPAATCSSASSTARGSRCSSASSPR